MSALLPTPVVRLAPILLLLACSAPPEPSAEPPPEVIDARAARTEDLVARIAEQLERGETDEPHALMNRLEHLLPAWQSEQRELRQGPLDSVLVQKVVTHFDLVAEAFREGPHERRLVAAWALGFSRVPPNDRGIVSRHEEARDMLVASIPTAPDDLLRNVLVGLWVLGDPATPLPPLLDVATSHHDAAVRANAVLALGTVLTDDTVERALDALLLALEDTDPKVRVHAASVVRRHPDPTLLARTASLVRKETTPLVAARMAMALGAGGDRTMAPLLVELLRSPLDGVATGARWGLVRLFGEDRGGRPEAWAPLLRAPR